VRPLGFEPRTCGLRVRCSAFHCSSVLSKSPFDLHLRCQTCHFVFIVHWISLAKVALNVALSTARRPAWSARNRVVVMNSSAPKRQVRVTPEGLRRARCRSGARFTHMPVLRLAGVVMPPYARWPDHVRRGSRSRTKTCSDKLLAGSAHRAARHWSVRCLPSENPSKDLKFIHGSVGYALR
jgi:hypothetical protein